MLPPAPLPATVVEIIVNSDVHTILETAVIAAELDGALSGDGPFTVFAPTDDAFGALPMGVLDDLLLDPTGALANILLYHVSEGTALSTDLSDGQMVPTLLGEDVMVTINGDGVFINDAQVILADLLADNGVVHVIDAVLLPPASTSVGEIQSQSTFTVYPNPSNGQITLSGDIELGGVLVVTNTMGQQVLTQRLVSKTLDLGSLSSGVYNLIIATDDAVVSSRVILN